MGEEGEKGEQGEVHCGRVNVSTRFEVRRRKSMWQTM
jgi:hypothetical protein